MNYSVHSPSPTAPHRILVIDDNASIHEDFRKILSGGPPEQEAVLERVEAELFGESPTSPARGVFEVVSAFQGQEGLEALRQAESESRPFAVAFVDMRMPPGWDGLETITRLWEVAPDLQTVICTAYSDHSWEEITARLGRTDKLVILKKPFDVVEVTQLANALVTKWQLQQQSKQHIQDLDEKIQKRTQELIQSETRYRVLFESMLEGFAYCRILFEDGRPQDFLHLEVNQAFERLTGLKDVVGKKASEVLPGLHQSNPELLRRFSSVALTGRSEKFEICIGPLGAWHNVTTYSPAKDHFIAIFEDVTERKQAELRLAAFSRLDHRLGAAKTAKEAAQIIVEIADELIGWDACLCDLYLEADQVVSHVLSMDLVDGKRAECGPAALNFLAPSPLARQALEQGGQLLLRQAAELPAPGCVPFGNVSRPSASLLYVPIRNVRRIIGFLSIQSYTPQAYDQGDLETFQALADRCGGAMERIRTEESLRHTQQELRHAQKLEGIGQLAGGVAHDFNNLLAVIRGNTELVLMEQQSLGPDTLSCLKQVVAAADRAANLTRQLLAFSRKQVIQPQVLSLNEVIANLTKMLKRLIGEHIELQCECRPNLPAIQADVGMLEQVLVNLVVNARDAMPQGGEVRIRTEAVSLDRAQAHAHPEGRPGEFLCVSVADSGTGIAPEHLPHIFEPFFTTKAVGHGTGLGLSTVYGIVKQHSGWVEVQSAPGKGSVFNLFLPVAETAANPQPLAAEVAGPARGGEETILLVEDEEAVRSVTRRLLARAGYSVHEVASGQEALGSWHGRMKEIDLVITDLVMPGGISGADMAKQLRLERPELKVIFVSGYSPHGLGNESHPLSASRSRFLQKPSPPTEFLKCVRECLDGIPPRQSQALVPDELKEERRYSQDGIRQAPACAPG